MRYRTKVTTVAAVGLVASVIVVGTAATFAWFSDTGEGAGSHAAAATVVLGRGGGAVTLDYKDLKPGDRQVTQLTISYQGSVPADIALDIAPSGSPALCLKHDGQWRSRPGGAVTVAIGSSAPVSYCELLNGRALPLAQAMRPRSEQPINVAVMLSADANDNLRGLAEKDVLTVRASGGFTDHVTGTISISTAGRENADKDRATKDSGSGENGKNDKNALPDTVHQRDAAIGTATGPSPQDPLPAALPGRPSVPLPAECAQAGMRIDSFEDVIQLGPDQHTWRALEQRGQGAGPFLIVGTGEADEIVGSGGADCIVGSGGDDKLAGGAGNDVLIGGAGVDQLDGEAGDDWLFGGPGVDELRGGGGIDRFDGGPDGASCDAGQDAAGVIRCHAPAPSTATSGAKDGPGEKVTSPTTTSPPPAENPPTTPSSPETTTVAPAGASSAPPSTPPAQAGSPADPVPDPDTADVSTPGETSESPVAASTPASAPPSSATRA